MLKVMIVDDEILARVGIKSIIPWRQHDFEVVAEAENGEQALALARELHPDIAITDIKMPLLNGVEFIKAVKEQGLTTKFIVLSSYGDFEYVKEAMKLGAEDYILKLKMEPEQLLHILNKLKEQIMLEKSRSGAPENDESGIGIYLPSMREALFNRLLFGYFVDHEEISRQFKLMNVELPPTGIYCLLTKVDHYEVFNKYKEQNDLYVMTYAMTNVVQEIVNEFHYGYAFSTKPMEVVVIYTDGTQNDSTSPAAGLRKLSERIQAALKQYLNISVSIGVSEGQPSYTDIKKGFAQAVKAAQNGFNLPRESIIFYRDMQEDRDNNGYAFQETFTKLEQACAAGSAEAVVLELKLLQQRLKDLPPDSLKGLCASVLFMLLSFSGGKEPILYESEEDDLFYRIEKFQVLQDYIEWFAMLIESVQRFLASWSEGRSLISQAKLFINEHYEENVSLQTVADHLHISANYLSHLFKKEAEENFIDHLIHVRIEHAKSLLAATGYKIYEIGSKVGYHDHFYFSKLFKKVVGVTPQQYRSGISPKEGASKEWKD